MHNLGSILIEIEQLTIPIINIYLQEFKKALKTQKKPKPKT